MKVSIIIRCLNEDKHIGKLLDGIQKQAYDGEIEIIVVDSGSRDQTLHIAKQYPTKIVQIKPEDFSFGYALNVGCQAATGDILLFASAHVYPVYNDWVALMAKPFERALVALVYGKQRGNHLNKYSEHQVFAKWFPDESNPNQNHPFCNNANCAIRRSLWQSHHYDESLTGLEDLAWAKQIQAEGHQIAYQGDATIIHVHEETWANVYNRYRREAIAFRLINTNESFNIFTFGSLLTKNILSDASQARHEGHFWSKIGEIFRFRWNQYYGTYRGYKESYLLDNEVRERFYYPKGYLATDDSNERAGKRIEY